MWRDLNTVLDSLAKRDKAIETFKLLSEAQNTETKQSKANISETKAEFKELKKENVLLHDKAEQYSRRNGLRIRGLPVAGAQSTDDVVCQLAEMLKVKQTRESISRSHFIGPNKQQIIVKFVSSRKRMEFIRARQSLVFTTMSSEWVLGV